MAQPWIKKASNMHFQVYTDLWWKAPDMLKEKNYTSQKVEELKNLQIVHFYLIISISSDV
jgi:hypothetical protein